MQVEANGNMYDYLANNYPAAKVTYIHVADRNKAHSICKACINYANNTIDIDFLSGGLIFSHTTVPFEEFSNNIPDLVRWMATNHPELKRAA